MILHAIIREFQQYIICVRAGHLWMLCYCCFAFHSYFAQFDFVLFLYWQGVCIYICETLGMLHFRNTTTVNSDELMFFNFIFKYHRLIHFFFWYNSMNFNICIDTCHYVHKRTENNSITTKTLFVISLKPQHPLKPNC